MLVVILNLVGLAYGVWGRSDRAANVGLAVSIIGFSSTVVYLLLIEGR